jgi:heme/copper-type cytochrome/quinol oxidase subunit 2
MAGFGVTQRQHPSVRWFLSAVLIVIAIISLMAAALQVFLHYHPLLPYPDPPTAAQMDRWFWQMLLWVSLTVGLAVTCLATAFSLLRMRRPTVERER